jgi:hypothetical protein
MTIELQATIWDKIDGAIGNALRNNLGTWRTSRGT